VISTLGADGPLAIADPVLRAELLSLAFCAATGQAPVAVEIVPAREGAEAIRITDLSSLMTPARAALRDR
jgi:hypothetical protein